MRALLTKRPVLAVTLASCAALAACDQQSNFSPRAEPSVALGLPSALLQARSVDRTQLKPVVTLSNGAVVSMRKVSDTGWSGTINVAPGKDYTLSVVWLETIGNRDLELAALQQTITVGPEGYLLEADSSAYSTSLDFDQDGISNLAERERNSDPFTHEEDNNTGEPTEVAAPSDTSPPTNPGTNDDTPDASTGDGIPDGDVPNDLPGSGSPPQEFPPTAPSSNNTDTPADPNPTDEPVTGTPGEIPSTMIADLIVPRISRSDAPEIDGAGVSTGPNGELTGEWASAVQIDSSGAALHINNLMIDIAAEAPDGTPYRRWAAIHDGKYLYVVVIVDDNGARIRDSILLTQDDSLELFLDGDNSKLSTYGDADDFHRIIPLRATGGSKQGLTSGDVPGPNSSLESLKLTFATGPGIGPRGLRRKNYEQDVYELRVELKSANIATNEPFGFELQVNDDDDGEARDSKWGWKHPSRSVSDVDNTVANPAFMGTLFLE